MQQFTVLTFIDLLAIISTSFSIVIISPFERGDGAIHNILAEKCQLTYQWSDFKD